MAAASLEIKPEDAALNFSHTAALESELRQLEICGGLNLQLRCRGQIMGRAPLQPPRARLSAQVPCLFRVNQEGFRPKKLYAFIMTTLTRILSGCWSRSYCVISVLLFSAAADLFFYFLDKMSISLDQGYSTKI